MKTKVYILIILSICLSLFFQTAASTAEDYQIEQSREKIWNLLQEQRPDYYNERPDVINESSLDKTTDRMAEADVAEADEYKVDKVAYYDKVELSDSVLTEQQNDYIYASMENEELNTKTDWTADAGEKDTEVFMMGKSEATEMAQVAVDQKTTVTKKTEPAKVNADSQKEATQEVKKATAVQTTENKTAEPNKKGILSGITSVFKGSTDAKTAAITPEVPVSTKVEVSTPAEQNPGNKGNVVLAKSNDQDQDEFKNEADEEEINVDKMLKTFKEDQVQENTEDEAEVISEAENIEDEHMDDEAELDENAESVWIKMKRKMSPSGMLKEEVAELEYWDVPVEEQSIDNISRNLKIEAAFKEAATITLPEEAEQQPVAENSAVDTPVQTMEEIIQKAIPQGYREKKIDLDFDDTNLSDILLIMGDAGNMNIVLDPALKNNTLDLHLKQIKLEDALMLVANSYELGFKLVGNALFITEKEKLRSENKISRIIKVTNINVQEAKQLVDDLADKVNISEELNSLTVVGDPADVAKVAKLIKEIDTPQPQVLLEAKIIEVNKDALKDLGVDWSDQINLLYQESGRPQDFDDVEESSSGIYRIAQIQRNPLQFETTIRMLEQQNKAKVLSAPRVTTLNGKEAEIFVGDEVPYTITNITGGVVTNDVRFVEPGIRLKITPSIIEDGFVVMKVEPEVSFIVTFRGPNDEFPQVRTREATAHVRVNNKQPFVLGGILNQEDKQSLFKVPFFGKLPLFGNLFSYEKSTAVDTELIITVVPTVVHGQE